MVKNAICIALLWALTLALAGTAQAETIRDLVRVKGDVPVPIEGYGIVTGLANTGDKSPAAIKQLRDVMDASGNNIDLSSLVAGTVALVRVSAEMPPYSRPGSTYPVTVTVVNDAKSLAGGELSTTVLYMHEGGQTVEAALAKGRVVTGGTVLTRGIIPANGAQQIAVYPFGRILEKNNIVRLTLKHPNYRDADNIARQINQSPSLNPYLQETMMFAEAAPVREVAIAKDPGEVIIMVPPQHVQRLNRYMADVLAVPVSIDRPAKILFNRSSNTVVITGDIRVNNASISLQDKTVTIRPETPERPAGYVLENETPRSLVELEGPGSYADLQGLIDTLNAMGLTTDQIITAFQELNEAGAIRAEIISR